MEIDNVHVIEFIFILGVIYIHTYISLNFGLYHVLYIMLDGNKYHEIL